MLFCSPLDDDPGALIEDFLSVLSASPVDDPHRIVNAGAYVGLAVEGKPFETHVLHGTESPSPGSVLGHLHAEGRTATQEAWTVMLRDRLHTLVGTGIDAAFLVRGLVHYVADWYAMQADIGEAKDRRASMREDLYAIADDPSRLAEYREHLTAQGSGTGRSDDEIASDLRRMGDRLAPPTAEEVTERWTAADAWRRDTERFLAR